MRPKESVATVGSPKASKVWMRRSAAILASLGLIGIAPLAGLIGSMFVAEKGPGYISLQKNLAFGEAIAVLAGAGAVYLAFNLLLPGQPVAWSTSVVWVSLSAGLSFAVAVRLREQVFDGDYFDPVTLVAPVVGVWLAGLALAVARGKLDRTRRWPA